MSARGRGIARRQTTDRADEGGDGRPAEVSSGGRGIVQRCGQGG